jgi:23S rRNA pseudouridine955/2504/2580 synthase
VSAGADFWAELPLGPGVKLLQRDGNGLAALDKPAGILSHPNAGRESGRALLQADYSLEGEYYQWGAGRLHLLNRLDSATSGVILAASDPALAEAIGRHFRAKAVGKVYQALVFGRPRAPAEIWRDRLSVEKRAGHIRTGPGRIPAESAMKVERSGPGLALLRLEPRTGRSHQLRVQCARRGLPIVGDQTYGDFRRNREFAGRTGSKRLFLHSLETSFDYEFNGRTFHFEARSPLPPEFSAFL